jgi:surface-anchored protein
MNVKHTCLAAAALVAVAGSSSYAAVQVTSEPTTYRFIVNQPNYVAPQGVTAFSNEHVDLDIVYKQGEWELGWHEEDSDTEFAADAAVALVPLASGLNRPAGPQWDFTGVNAGQTIYVLPQTQNPSLVFLGMATEESDASALVPWDPDGAGPRGSGIWTRLNLVSVSGPNGSAAPGAVSIWQTDGFGSLNVSVASSDGVSDADAVFLQGFGHAHYNYGFSAPGIYDVTFAATTAIVPEPATAGLLAAFGGLLLRRRRA